MLKKALSFAQELVKERLREGDVAIDATCGTGYDTVFLAELVGKKGKVYAFDIQREAIKQTRSKLEEEGLLSRVELICDTHSKLDSYIMEQAGAVMFNLGYLPGGDHNLVTKPETTIEALKKSLKLLSPGGIITIICYRGHKGGKEEYSALVDFCRELDQKHFTVLEYKFINQVNYPPLLLALERL